MTTTTEYLKVLADVVVNVRLHCVASVQPQSAQQQQLLKEVLDLLKPHITGYVEKYLKKKKKGAEGGNDGKQKKKNDTIIRGENVKFMYEFMPVGIYQQVVLTRNMWKQGSYFKSYKMFPEKLMVYYQPYQPKPCAMLGLNTSQATISNYFGKENVPSDAQQESLKTVLSTIVSKSGPKLSKSKKKPKQSKPQVAEECEEVVPKVEVAEVELRDPFLEMQQSEEQEVETRMTLQLLKDSLQVIAGNQGKLHDQGKVMAGQGKPHEQEKVMAGQDKPSCQDKVMTGQGKPHEPDKDMAGQEKPPNQDKVMAGQDKPPEQNKDTAGHDKPCNQDKVMAGQDKPHEQDKDMAGHDRPCNQDKVIACQDLPHNQDKVMAGQDRSGDTDSKLLHSAGQENPSETAARETMEGFVSTGLASCTNTLKEQKLNTTETSKDTSGGYCYIDLPFSSCEQAASSNLVTCNQAYPTTTIPHNDQAVTIAAECSSYLNKEVAANETHSLDVAHQDYVIFTEEKCFSHRSDQTTKESLNVLTSNVEPSSHQLIEQKSQGHQIDQHCINTEHSQGAVADFASSTSMAKHCSVPESFSKTCKGRTAEFKQNGQENLQPKTPRRLPFSQEQENHITMLSPGAAISTDGSRVFIEQISPDAQIYIKREDPADALEDWDDDLEASSEQMLQAVADMERELTRSCGKFFIPAESEELAFSGPALHKGTNPETHSSDKNDIRDYVNKNKLPGPLPVKQKQSNKLSKTGKSKSGKALQNLHVQLDFTDSESESTVDVETRSKKQAGKLSGRHEEALSDTGAQSTTDSSDGEAKPRTFHFRKTRSSHRSATDTEQSHKQPGATDDCELQTSKKAKPNIKASNITLAKEHKSKEELVSDSELLPDITPRTRRTPVRQKNKGLDLSDLEDNDRFVIPKLPAWRRNTSKTELSDEEFLPTITACKAKRRKLTPSNFSADKSLTNLRNSHHDTDTESEKDMVKSHQVTCDEEQSDASTCYNASDVNMNEVKDEEDSSCGLSTSRQITDTSGKDEPEDIFADCFIVDDVEDIIVVEDATNDRLLMEIAEVQKVQHLTDEQLEYLVHSNIPYIKDIFRGKEYSERHEKYKKGVREQIMLRYAIPMGQFRERQHEIIMNVLTGLFCKKSTKFFDYVFKVLLPEILIKICMDVQHISHTDAQDVLEEINMSQMIDC